MGKIKYFGAYITPILALITFNVSGIFAYAGIFFLYLLIPILENIIPKDSYNFSKAEKQLAKHDFYYDLILYLLVPLHLYVIYVFLNTIFVSAVPTSDLIAYVLMMGTLLGVNGINGGHELGHKTDHPFKLFLAHILLTTSIQNHFVTYHNSGHHRDVATPNDLTSAKKGDIFYLFAIRSQIGGYFKTWRLESEKLKKQGKNKWFNPMIIYTLIPWLFLFLIYSFFGTKVALLYFAASVFGISILEAQNYFSHYGLRRIQKEDGNYEGVKAIHSWNSDHIFGRVLLFELTRHSDHHYLGAKPYQLLESREESPMLPFGYPAMLILSYLPFLFIPIMGKQLKKYGIES
ncbi:MAG: alkane 1-monooxygenase [Crocinitomicaceae bacterium]|tara:strand:- start:6096 stop:7136 length:1041 start_codon:yes stop_codon:yes gene_type:complete